MRSRSAQELRSPFVSRTSLKPVGKYKGLTAKADPLLHEQLTSAVTLRVPPPAHVLDFGAGQGALSQRLADLGYSVTSVDIDVDDFSATTPFERIDFNDQEHVDAFRRRHAGEFDIVLGVEVIEHVENPWQYVRDLAGLAKPGGWVVVTTPNVTSWISRMTFLRYGRHYQFLDYDRQYGHINPVAADELDLVMRGAGLRVESITSAGWLPRLWLSRAPTGLLANLVGFAMSWGMRGLKQGWCIMAIARKPLASDA